MQLIMKYRVSAVIGFAFLHLASADLLSDILIGLAAKPSCNSTIMFQCYDGTCFNKSSVCDGVPNCSEAEDEKNCDFIKCRAPSFFQCADGQCIPSASRCNKLYDCSDHSDELGCSAFEHTTTLETCAPDHFQCMNSQCIPRSWLCDKKSDCMDGSDETSSACSLKKSCEDDQFRCGNGTCIPGNFRCDNFNDCDDGLDEKHCEHQPIDLTNCTAKNQKFACKDQYKCIDMRETCDGTVDCYDKSDETGACWMSNPIACKNCTHKCKNTPDGSVCLCDVGYVLEVNNNTCLDINECESYGICDQKCSNTAGSYSCSCDRNYILQEDRRSCILKSDSDEMLMYSTVNMIKGVSPKNPEQILTLVSKVPVTSTIAAVDAHVYLAIIENDFQAIMKTHFGGGERQMIVTNGVKKPEGLAVDWITKNIYFSDQRFKHIAVCSNDGYSCAVLHSRYVDKPRAIALSPEHGLMFWTDWGHTPMIGRSGMDGTNFIPFVSNDIMWPNGVTVDVPNERVYWMDADRRRIETINFDQTDRRIVLAESIKHPFSIAIFENKLYWSDFDGQEILSCNKFTGKERLSLIRESKSRIYGLHLYHHLLQKTEIENPCAYLSVCSDMCLLGTSSTKTFLRAPIRSCACPTNKKLSADGMTCKEIHPLPTIIAGVRDELHIIEHRTLGRDKIEVIPLKNMDISALAYNPNKGTVLIANDMDRMMYSYDLRTKEKPKPFVMSGLGVIRTMQYDDYGNNLYWVDGDSLSVEALSLTTLARTLIIDGNIGEMPSDIALVPEEGFMFVAFIVGYSHVHVDRVAMDGALSTRVCFIEKDKLLGPEIKLHYSSVMKRLFWIDLGSLDIQSVSLNGQERMTNVPGVHAYTLTSVDGILFWITTGSGIINWHDFDQNDSNNHLKLSVESDVLKNDRIALTVISKPSNYTSPCQVNNGGCSHLCLVSKESDFKRVCACPLGYSLSVNKLECVKPVQCAALQFQCYTGECIPTNRLCDSTRDCIHGEDELIENCNVPRCPADQFLCSDLQKCIDRKKWCDGQRDCSDGSDEVCNSECTAASGKFLCDSGECIDLHFRCDGKRDCKRGQDEYHCGNTTCTPNDFKCKSGQCIPREWECDTEIDCMDGSDEQKNCERDECSPHEFRCTNSKCVDTTLACNGFDDCGDGSDEIQCPTVTDGISSNYVYRICNPQTEFFCPSNERPCLPISVRCNGTKECKNGEDEAHCTTNPCAVGEEFYCANEMRCIPIEWTCDNDKDCSDGSDEDKSTCFVKPKKDELCSGFRCANGTCILLSQVCNNVADCIDGSDEGGKCGISCENFGCSSKKCFRLPSGPKCECVSGYYLGPDNKTCLDEDECDMDMCAQNCSNTPGSFTCSCFSPEYKLRSDHMSCKATGPSLIYVTASENKLTFISNNMKHTKGLTFGAHLFNNIKKIDIDVHRNYVFVLFENNILQRTVLGPRRRKVQKVLPKITDFTVDWITDNIYYTNGSNIRITNLNHSMDDLDEELHNAGDRLIWALAVDPVAGYLFWFDTNPLVENERGLLKRMDGLGENVRNISSFNYDIQKLVVDSFARHLYWFNSRTQAICRMDYDGYNQNAVVYTGDNVITFAFFENSVYWSAENIIPIKKCRTYGLPPRKCEIIKLNVHSIRHLAILQKNGQRLGPHPAGNFSSEMMCAMSPSGPKCVCPDDLRGNNLCTSFVSPSRSQRSHRKQTSLIEDDSSSGAIIFFAAFVIFSLIASIGVIAYWHYCKPKSKIMHRLHFHNAVYDVPESAYVASTVQEPLLNPGDHYYENPLCQNEDTFESSKPSTQKAKKAHLQPLQEEPDSEYGLSNPKSFKEPLIKD